MRDTLPGMGTTQEVTFLREEILVRKKRPMHSSTLRLCCPRVGVSKLQISLWTICEAHYGAFVYSI